MGIYADTVGCGPGGDLEDAEANLQVHLKLDGNAGPLYDSTENGNDFNAIGGLLFEEAGKDGNALKAVTKGADYLFLSGAGFAADDATDWSANFWFKLDGSVFEQGLFSLTNGSDYFTLRLTSGTQGIVLYRAGSTNSAANVTFAISDVDDGAWHMVTITYNTTTRLLSIYFDNVLAYSVTITIAKVIDGSICDLYIGLEQDNALRDGMTGWLDEFKYWDYLLTTGMVGELFTLHD